MIMLDNKDNQIFKEHLYELNKSLDIVDKIAMDVYIEYIQFTDNDILLSTRIIEPILDTDIIEDNVGKSSGEIGDRVIRRISEFTEPYNSTLKSAIREIKLNKLIIE